MSEFDSKHRSEIPETSRDAESLYPEASLGYSPTNCSPSERLKKSALIGPEQESPADLDQPIEPGLGVDPVSIEEKLERELAISLHDLQDDADVVSDGTGNPQQDFEQACMKMVKQVQEEIHENQGQHIEQDLAKIEATYEAFEEQHSTWEHSQASGSQTGSRPHAVPPQHTPAENYSRGFATKFAVIVLALGVTGAFLNVHKHPVVSKGIANVSHPCL